MKVQRFDPKFEGGRIGLEHKALFPHRRQIKTRIGEQHPDLVFAGCHLFPRQQILTRLLPAGRAGSKIDTTLDFVVARVERLVRNKVGPAVGLGPGPPGGLRHLRARARPAARCVAQDARRRGG